MQNKECDFFCVCSPQTQPAVCYELLTEIMVVLKFLHVNDGLISKRAVPSLGNTGLSHLEIRY